MRYGVISVLGTASFVAVLSLGSQAFADGHDCALQEVTGTETADTGLQCLLRKIEALGKENEALSQKVRALEATPSAQEIDVSAIAAELAANHAESFSGRPDAGAEVPSGAVVAFDRPDICPAGWRRFEPANSRFIIGAATVDDLEAGPAGFRNGSDGVPLSARPFGEPRGREEHKLTMNQMPNHVHTGSVLEIGDLASGTNKMVVHLSTRGAQDNAQVTRSVPNIPDSTTEPHNNMPPYIALYYCKKT